MALGAEDRFQDAIERRRWQLIVVALTPQDAVDQPPHHDRRKEEAIVIADRDRLEAGRSQHLLQAAATVTAEMMMADVVMIEEEVEGGYGDQQPAVGTQDLADGGQAGAIVADVLDDVETDCQI